MNSVQLALLTYSAISAAHALLGSHRGAAATVVSVVMNVACELWVASAADWHQGFTIQGVFCRRRSKPQAYKPLFIISFSSKVQKV